MGKTRRHTAAAKRRKRFNQKVRCKLFVQARENEESLKPLTKKVDTSVEPSEFDDYTLQRSDGSVSANSDGNIMETQCKFLNFQTSDTCTCLGEDMDVALMKTDDCLIELENDDDKSAYTYEYLLDCREKLMKRVKTYRQQIEEQSSKMTSMAYEHKKQLQHIRSFYQGIAYAPTRTGRIVKSAHCSTSAAAEIMHELGLKYKQN